MKRLLLLSLFLFIFVNPAYAESGLVAYYNFDEGNGTVLHDVSGNGNDGAIYGAAWTRGINGSALGFDGAGDYVYRSDDDGLDITGDMTVISWINHAETSSGDEGIISKDSFPRWKYAYQFVIRSNNKIHFFHRNSGSQSEGYNSTGTVSSSGWHQVAYTINGTTLTFYIDGASSGNNTLLYSRSGTNDKLYVGTENPQPNNYFNGTIDEVKIYNRALTPEEIKAEYEKYSGDGLVAYYSFNEGNGTELHDDSGNENDGTIYGATWTTGISEGALSFDGVNDYATMPDSTSLGVSRDITVEAWIYPKSNGYINPVLAKGTYAGNFAYFLAIGSNYADDLSFQLGNVGGPGIITGNVSISPNAWYYVVGTRSGNIMRTYVNGQVSYEMNVETTNIRTNSLNLDIGRYVQAGESFNGLIDEVKIYNRALSAEEIKQEYDKYANPDVPIDSDGDGLPDENETAYQLDPYSKDTDSDGINDSVEYAILTKYFPIFQYTGETQYLEFYPQPIGAFLEYSDLYEFSGKKAAEGPFSEGEISAYGGKYYLDFKEWDLNNRTYRLNMHKIAYDKTVLPEYGYALYMRAVPSAYNGTGHVVLQYWHHYLYNDFINNHEGDWEMVEILLDNATLEPSYAAYSQHVDSIFRNGGEIKRWADVQKEGNHPWVYVAEGSHASYFEAGARNLIKWVNFMLDQTSSLGRKLDAGRFNQSILRDDANPDTQKWLVYGGRWGRVFINDTDLLGSNGGVGPKQQAEKWSEPAYWGLKYLTRVAAREYVVVRLGGGALTVSDKFNRVVGYINSNIIKQIPKSEVVSVIGKKIYILPLSLPDAGAGELFGAMSAGHAPAPAQYTYTVEPNGTYYFELYLANETEAKHIVFYNVSGTSGTKDNVWVLGNKIYMNTTDDAKRLNAMLEYMTDAGEVSTNLTGMLFEGDETLVIDVKDWTRINETGAVAVEAARNKCRLKDGCTKVISHSNDITGLLLRILGPGQIELVHWNNRSGKVITKN